MRENKNDSNRDPNRKKLVSFYKCRECNIDKPDKEFSLNQIMVNDGNSKICKVCNRRKLLNSHANLFHCNNCDSDLYEEMFSYRALKFRDIAPLKCWQCIFNRELKLYDEQLEEGLYRCLACAVIKSMDE